MYEFYYTILEYTSKISTKTVAFNKSVDNNPLKLKDIVRIAGGENGKKYNPNLEEYAWLDYYLGIQGAGVKNGNELNRNVPKNWPLNSKSYVLSLNRL